MEFVTAKLKGKKDCRQGWLLEKGDDLLYGQSGAVYRIEGEPVVVVNPPALSDKARQNMPPNARNQRRA